MCWLRAGCPSLSQDELDELGPAATSIHELLERRGALFLPELVSDTGLTAIEVADALWQLVCAGAAHADGFASLRLLVGNRRRVRASRFDDQTSTNARSSKWLRAINKARGRDRARPAHAAQALPSASGRWSLLPLASSSLDADRIARQLLHRYGIVFRELLARESHLPKWRELLSALRRLEARGEIRGGRFVSGFVGEQFALPEAVEGLRAARRPDRLKPQIVRISAADPLNLIGITSPGARVPAILGNTVLYRDGTPIATVVAGEQEIRGPLGDGESIGDDLSYQKRDQRPPEQVTLPI